MFTRWVTLFTLIILGGCSVDEAIRIDGDAYIGNLIVASPYRSGWCFTRYEQGLPYDEICESGNRLLYTTNLERSRTKRPEEIPAYVLGLFDYMSQEREIN